MTNPLYNTVYDEIQQNQDKVKEILLNLDYLNNLIRLLQKEERQKNEDKFKRFCAAVQDVINNPEKYS